jgi:hypothetical protein
VADYSGSALVVTPQFTASPQVDRPEKLLDSSEKSSRRTSNRLLEDAMAVSDTLTRLRGDAQELLRGPMNRDAARELAVISRGVIRQREHINRIASLNSRAPNPAATNAYVELTRARATDAITYLDLAAKAIDQAAGPDPAGSAVGDVSGLDLRPDPTGARTPADLVAVLRDFRVWAGEPSYREMSDRNNGRPAASTIYTALSSDELPKLDMVTAIVTGCGGGKEDQARFASAWRAIRTGATTTPPEKPELDPASLIRAMIAAGKKPEMDPVSLIMTAIAGGWFPASLRGGGS